MTHPAFTVPFLSPCRCVNGRRDDHCPVPGHRVEEGDDL